MRYAPLNADLYIGNRSKLAPVLGSNGMAVLLSNDIMPTNADGHMGFRQNNDLLYLTGIDQEETLFIMFPGASDPAFQEVLFLKETNEEIAIWEGEKLTKARATALSGIKTIYWLKDFKRIYRMLMAEAASVYLSDNEHIRAVIEVETRTRRFLSWSRRVYPLHEYKRLSPSLQRLRAIKSPEEITRIEEACAITEQGFRKLLTMVKPGVWEYEIEAELIYEFTRRRAEGFAYSPIIASGPSACVLHYTENNRMCEAGHLLLLDIGASYANYAADLSRCIPVNGRFTPRQREVYNAVLTVQKAAIAMLKPGIFIKSYTEAVGNLMEEALLQLGLITSEDIRNQDPAWPAYKRYFMHGTSHFLGLDVHDVGFFHEKVQPGMVFTCEPGIYIREEGIGVRIENDILITEKGNRDLMASIPIEAAEIEDLMNA
jgi:Xaa-Pro aminopeptidase